MARFKELFTLYPRELASGKVVWYYQTYDDKGRRTVGRSTGQTTEAKAKRWCQDLHKTDKLVPKTRFTLAEWAEERKWWIWGECLYCKGRLARSSPDKPAISQRYADDCLRILKTRIIPKHGHLKLEAITSEACEALLFAWAEKDGSSKSVNNWATVYRTMTGEAFRLGLIPEDPWKRVPLFVPSSKPRDTLTLEEARTLLNPATVDTIWKGHRLYWLINLTAALTGCRQGELLSLRKEDLFKDHIQVDHSWHIRYGMGPTKTKVKAPVPIPPFLYEALVELAVWDGYLFSFTNGDSPCTGNRVTDALYAALAEIGIPDIDRRERNIVFHSWRKFLNTWLRSQNVSDAKIQAVTRHATQEMTEHYTVFKVEDFSEVSRAQEALMGRMGRGS
jgi:integrase